MIQFGSFLISVLVVLALVGGPDSDDDFIVPDDYVGPAIENPLDVEELEPGFEIVDWFDLKGPPVALFADEFGLEAEEAAALLRWQDDVTDSCLSCVRFRRSVTSRSSIHPAAVSVDCMCGYMMRRRRP